MPCLPSLSVSFVSLFNDTTTSEIYTLSLHDALPIFDELDVRGRARLIRQLREQRRFLRARDHAGLVLQRPVEGRGDRKSTRLNSSHANISYAVFCLKKKKQMSIQRPTESHCHPDQIR